MRPLAALEKLMRLIKGTGELSREVRLPPGYRVDRSDPEVFLALPRWGGGRPLQRSGRHH